MKYAIKRRQWELTLEEKEKAQFIVDYCDEVNTKQGRSGVSEINQTERSAFEVFKSNFYWEVADRLKIRYAISNYSLKGYTLRITDDLQVEGYSVEPVEEE